MKPSRETVLYAFLIAFITVLVYFSSFNNSFIWDDHAFVVGNAAIRNLDASSARAIFTGKSATSSNDLLSGDVWRPLTILSFAIDRRLWGLDPRFYHIENTLLHVANAILVFLVAGLILRNRQAGLVAGILFALHPVQTEAVTWISGRANVLFLFFYLAALYLHIRHRIRQRQGYYVGILVSLLLALLSKEMAVTLPLILLIFDIAFVPWNKTRYYVKYHAPLFLTVAAYLIARVAILGRLAQRDVWWGGSFGSAVLTTCTSLVGYLRLLCAPVNLRAEYLVDIPRSVFDKDVVFAICMLVVVAASFFAARRRTVRFFIAWFFVTLLPVYNIVPFKAVMAERFLYLPSIAFTSLVAFLFSRYNDRLKTPRYVRCALEVILVLLVVAYGVLTVARNAQWKDERTFCKAEVARTPGNPRFRFNLATAYLRDARDASTADEAKAAYADALKELKGAILADRFFYKAYTDLGYVYNELGQYDLAILHSKKAIALGGDPAAYANLGVSYYQAARYDDALAAFRDMLRIDPNNTDAILNLGNVLYMKKEYAKAKQAWIRSLRLGETDPKTVQHIRELEKQGY